MFGGDDSLIKRQVGIIFVLVVLIVALVIAFGLITFYPNNSHDFSCTYTYHPILTTRSFQLEEPLFPRACHG